MNNSDGQQPSIKKLPWRSLTWQLIFLTILPLTALVLIVAFGSLTVHQNAMRIMVGERDERAARFAAAALEEQIKHRTSAVRSLAWLAEGAEVEKLAEILASSDYLLPEFDGGLAFFNPQAMLESATGNQKLWEELTSQIAAKLPELPSINASTIYTSTIFTRSANGESMLVILAASPAGDQIAAGAFSVTGMMQHTLTNTFTHDTEASIIIIDAGKNLLYQGGSHSYLGEISSYPGVAEALQGKSGTTYVQTDGSEHVVAYSPIAPLGWALVLEEPWEMIESPTLRISQLAPLVLVPVLILAVVALWFGAQQIVKPLQTLASRAATLARGDFKTIEEPVGGIEEIRRLQNELSYMAHQVQAAQQGLHGYIGAITAAQEDERRRLARELHDDTIQALIALKQRVQLTQLSAACDEPDAAALQALASLTEQTIENLRRLTRALRPIYLEDLGLVTALEMLAREMAQALNIPFEFQRLGSETRLGSEVELALYRMAQEACNNIARHAQASQALLKITFTPQTLTIQVTDNGKGFEVPKSPAEFAPSGHYGLLGLHERAELIGAALEIQSEPGRGTQLSINLPLTTTT